MKDWQTSQWLQTFKYINVELIVLVAHDALKPTEITKNIPLLALGCQPPEKNIKCDYVALDRFEVAQIAINHLRSTGYGYIINACPTDSIIGHKFLAELKKLKLSHTHFELNLKEPENELIKLLEIYHEIKTKERKAIFFGDTPLAVKFMEIAIKAKIKIPHELAIISYDYFPWADAMKVPLTTICQPIKELSQRAIEIIKLRLENKKSSYIHETLSHELIIREST